MLTLILLEYEISIFFLSLPWSGDFQQTANKVDFILKKNVYIET